MARSSRKTTYRQFSAAITNGQPGQLTKYLANGMSPNVQGAAGLTPLALAWQNNDWQCAELLLDYGARINGLMTLEGMGDGNTLLHLVSATRGADASWINFLGEHGAEPDAENSLGCTPMYYATSLFSTHKIKSLADIGASGARIYRNRPVLHMAAIKHSASLLKALVEAGTSIDCRDEDGRTVLHYANQFRSNRVLEEVLALGADPNARDREGNTPLHTVAGSLALHSMHPVFLANFQKAGARLNTCNDRGETILHKLPWRQPPRAKFWLESLLAAGANPDIMDNSGQTPLMLAAQHDDQRLATMLLEAGARKLPERSPLAIDWTTTLDIPISAPQRPSIF